MIHNPYEGYRYRSIAGEKTVWKGCWLTSYRFFHIKTGHAFSYLGKSDCNSEIQNIHTIFKKKIFLKDRVKQARLFITGDDLYKLYVNSSFVGEGPAQSYPFSYNYNCFDVSDLLMEGENSIGVHLYYQGLHNIYLVSADNLCGFIAQLEIEYADGEKETIVTDRSWKYTECDAYFGHHTFGYQTQFSENIDMNCMVCPWGEGGKKDVAWEQACIAGRPYPEEYVLTPQITPTVKHEKRMPKQITKTDEGFFFDFGEEAVGTLVFCAKGKIGETLRVQCGEELLENGRVRHEMRAGCDYDECITLSGQEEVVDFYDYKGFRYAEILGREGSFDPLSVFFFTRNYPFPEKIASFSCSDMAMNDVWDICVRGVRVGTQDTYLDCPTREKGGYIGDALITGLSHLILTGDIRVYKKFLCDCANASRYCPPLMAHLPTYILGILADYSALIPLFLEQYYQYTGDREFTEKMLSVCEGIFEYYSQFLNKEMLFERLHHMEKVPESAEVILVDWPWNLRDGYDMEKAKNGVCTVVNVYFYGFMKTLSKLYLTFGNKQRAQELEDMVTALGEAIIRHTYNREKGLFQDAPDSDHVSLHANVLPLFYGLVPPNGYKPIIDFIKKKRLNCGVYFAYFLIKGLYNIGEDALAFDLLTGHDEHSWNNMVKEGATTCMEVWGASQKHNTSWCHPWSSSPIGFYVTEIMGIRCGKPGMSVIKIRPKPGDTLCHASVELPLPSGFLRASFERTVNGLKYTVKAPRDVEVVFEGKDIDFIRE